MSTEDTKRNIESICDAEVDWMLQQRALVPDDVQLRIDYGEVAEEMLRTLTHNGFQHLLGALMWPGISTRWKAFNQWLLERKADNSVPADCRAALIGFGNSLGFVTSYRCLSLTPNQFQTIKDKNSIWPTGRLKAEMQVLRDVINKHGVWKIAHARLYIGRRLIGPYDPSLSLHDDPETAVCIAGGYLDASRRAYLMEMRVPKVEVLGYRLCDVQDADDVRWFRHRGVWFDASLERTERYCLYEIPFFNERCRSVREFATNAEMDEFVKPFKEAMLVRKQQQQ